MNSTRTHAYYFQTQPCISLLRNLNSSRAWVAKCNSIRAAVIQIRNHHRIVSIGNLLLWIKQSNTNTEVSLCKTVSSPWRIFGCIFTLSCFSSFKYCFHVWCECPPGKLPVVIIQTESDSLHDPSVFDVSVTASQGTPPSASRTQLKNFRHYTDLLLTLILSGADPNRYVERTQQNTTPLPKFSECYIPRLRKECSMRWNKHSEEIERFSRENSEKSEERSNEYIQWKLGHHSRNRGMLPLVEDLLTTVPQAVRLTKNDASHEMNSTLFPDLKFRLSVDNSNSSPSNWQYYATQPHASTITLRARGATTAENPVSTLISTYGGRRPCPPHRGSYGALCLHGHELYWWRNFKRSTRYGGGAAGELGTQVPHFWDRRLRATEYRIQVRKVIKSPATVSRD